jgi:hypothetical protein
MGKFFCRLVIWLFAGIYVLAIAVFLIGSLGWFGAKAGPLSGLYLVLLGQPWVRFVDSLPEPVLTVAVVLTPAINLAILYVICRLLGSRRRHR